MIGFDFGTSASKIVVKAPFLPGEPRFLVQQKSDSDDGVDWLWPSSFVEDSYGVCSLHGDAAFTHDDIKLRLMDTSAVDAGAADGVTARRAVAAYFGLMLRTIRTQVLEAHTDVLRTFTTLDWSLNVGIPSGWTEVPSRENPASKALEAAFQSAVEAGWRLSLRGEPFSLKDAEDTLRSGENSGIEIGLIPEVIAGALGYAKSDERRDGLHLMMDVGAGTVDACLFRLRTEDEEENWPLLEARVERLGTAELHRRRVAAVRCVDEEQAEKLERTYDPFDGVTVVSTTPCPDEPAVSAVEAADDEITAEVNNLAGYFVQEALNGRDPNAAELKTEGILPVLRMGGGVHAQPYRSALFDLHGDLLKKLPSGQRGVRTINTPVPSELNRTTNGMGYRLAVAVGLSEPKLNQPNFRRPSEIPNIPKDSPARSGPEIIGKEHV